MGTLLKVPKCAGCGKLLPLQPKKTSDVSSSSWPAAARFLSRVSKRCRACEVRRSSKSQEYGISPACQQAILGKLYLEINGVHSFNQFDLPEYPTFEILNEKVLYAIKETVGFGFAWGQQPCVITKWLVWNLRKGVSASPIRVRTIQEI